MFLIFCGIEFNKWCQLFHFFFLAIWTGLPPHYLPLIFTACLSSHLHLQHIAVYSSRAASSLFPPVALSMRANTLWHGTVCLKWLPLVYEAGWLTARSLQSSLGVFRSHVSEHHMLARRGVPVSLLPYSLAITDHNHLYDPFPPPKLQPQAHYSTVQHFRWPPSIEDRASLAEIPDGLNTSLCLCGLYLLL